MEKPRKITTRQYVGLVCDLNSRMAQIPPLFEENQQLDKSELVDSFANKAPRSHKAMLISQGFNIETGYLVTFVEHCKRAETTDNISVARSAASDENSNTKRKKSVPSSRNVKKTVSNVIRNTPRFIALSVVKTKATPLGSANSSRQGLKIETILIIQLRISRGNPEK